MSLFQCQLCGCCENTALSSQGFDAVSQDLYDWTGFEDRKGKKLCSACGPTRHSDGTPTEFGKWHGQFPRVFLPLGMFRTARNGNLEHIETGDQNYRQYAIAAPDGIDGRALEKMTAPEEISPTRVSDLYLQNTLLEISRAKALDSQLISTAFLRMLLEEIIELRAADAPKAVDAARWRALINCGRVRVLGSAGIHKPGTTGYAHIGVEFWTHHPTKTDPAAIEDLITFTDRVVAARLARIEQLMKADPDPATADGQELLRLVDEQEKAEAHLFPSAQAPSVTHVAILEHHDTEQRVSLHSASYKAVLVPPGQSLDFDPGPGAERRWLWPYLGYDHHLVAFIEVAVPAKPGEPS